MNNQYDTGMRTDFNNMTMELGREVIIYRREFKLNHEGQEGDNSGLDNGTKEIVFMQEMDSQNEVVAAGVMAVGDVRITFNSSTVAEEECIIEDTAPSGFESIYYKVIGLNKVGSMSNNIITHVTAYGKRISLR